MNNQTISLENYFAENEILNVYPITIIKYLLNKNKILFLLKQKGEYDFSYPAYSIDNGNCHNCKKVDGKFKECRQHFSIRRVLNSSNELIIRDPLNDIYFYKNEIFRINDEKRLTIIYCPHTKLIRGNLNVEKIKKIYPITVIDNKVKDISFSNVKDLDFNYLKNKNMTCWFNDELTIKVSKVKHFYKWSFILNK